MHQLLEGYVMRAPHRDRVMALVGVADSQGSGPWDGVVLFNGGVAQEFLERRGGWLRADERVLLEGWLNVPIGLYEVTSISPGRGVTIRALPDGEPFAVRDRVFSEEVERLDLVLARVLNDGSRPKMYTAPLLVHRRRRVEMIELLATGPTPEDIAAFFGPRPALAPSFNEDGQEPEDDLDSLELDSLTPAQLVEVMESSVREEEQKWLDQQIPALDGMSPRQAAATGGAARAELDALLDDFEWMHRRTPMGMSGSRIRQLLGM